MRNPWRFTVVMFGQTLLDIHAGPETSPPSTPPVASTETGPVTDRRSAPVLGFASIPIGVRRARLGERPVVK